ncbi:hypothetical protein [Geomonas agri]|uniref:hypothetical protein n=1 Tax=Geomonas agri TaxID=2873702 RepID=UPI001CD41E43|nr:hypothetical protein [Geomonas agri]
MAPLRLLITCFALMLLTGCFQVTTVVRVNRDGSGTVEETVFISKKVVAQIEEMFRSLKSAGGKVQGAGGKDNPFDLFEPDQLKGRANSMGKGVSYLSGERVENKDFKGYVARYAFRDINTLQLSHRSGADVTANIPKIPLLNFSFKKGPKGTLVINFPKATENHTVHAAPDPLRTNGSAPAESSPEIFIPPLQTARDAETAPEVYSPKVENPAITSDPLSEEKKREMMAMFMGMKFALVVEVNGTILSTDATHRDGNRLTIFDFDMTRLSNPTTAELETLSLLRSGFMPDVKELSKAIPGIKVELNEKLTVVFQ